MKPNFRVLATVTALTYFALAIGWLWAPNLFLSDWGVELTASAGLVGRRAAALYAGIAVMFLSARNAAPSPARTALIRGVVIACLMLAVLGLYELWAGHATARILVAVGAELGLTLAFLFISGDTNTVVILNNRKRR